MIETKTANRNKASQHKWTKEDEIVALYLWKYGEKEPGGERKLGIYTIQTISNVLEIKPNSIKMKITNYEALTGGRGLDGYSEQMIKVFKKYKNTPEPELRQIAEKIIEDVFAAKRAEKKEEM